MDLLVSCLTPAEEHELGLTDEIGAAARAGIAFLRLPIEDFSTPLSPSDVEGVVAQIERRRSAGGRVVVHCRGGGGRSPLVVAAVLVRGSADPEQAWALISARRGQAVPETEEQRKWVERFASTTSHTVEGPYV